MNDPSLASATEQSLVGCCCRTAAGKGSACLIPQKSVSSSRTHSARQETRNGFE